MISTAIPRAITTDTMTFITWQILRVGAKMLRIIPLEPHDDAHGRSMFKKETLVKPKQSSLLSLKLPALVLQLCLQFDANVSLHCFSANELQWLLNHTNGPVLRHMQLGLRDRKIAWLQKGNSQQFRAIWGLRPWHPQQPCAWSDPPHERSSPTRCHTSTQPSRR